MIDFKEHKIMTPTGLTLDNLVYNRHCEVHALRIMDFHAWDHPLMNQDYGFYGIPLTEDWLKRSHLGLIEIRGAKVYFNGDNIFIRIEDMALFLHDESNGAVFFFKRLKYVHDLQNAYQIIEGHEIEFENK